MKSKKILLQARCEDGENICLSTEWSDMEAEKIIDAFIVLGIRVGIDLCGENAHVVYKEFEKAFHSLQAPGKAKEVIEMMKEEN